MSGNESLPPTAITSEDLLLLAGEQEASRINTFIQIAPQLQVSTLEVNFDIDSEDPKQSFLYGMLGPKPDPNYPTLHLLPEFASTLNGQLAFKPYKSQGGKKSRHGVFFGRLEGMGQLDVVVKPFARVEGHQSERACFADFFGNTAASRLGLGSLRSVGVITGTEDNLYSLTVLERALVTFDSIDWTGFLSRMDNNPGMRDLWIKAARSIAVLHSTGDSSHGDLYLRNIATNSEGQVFLIDWEESHINTHCYRDLEARFGKHWRDLGQLIECMAYPTNLPAAGSGMFNRLEGDWWEAFDKIFFSEYKEWRMNLAEEGKHHMTRLGETNEEIKQLEVSLKSQLYTIQNLYSRKSN